MKKYVSKLDNPVFISGLMIVLGLILFIWPRPAATAIVRLIGVTLLLSGASTAWTYYEDRNSSAASLFQFVVGILVLITGLWLIIRPYALTNFVSTIIGLVLLLNGIVNLMQALEQRRIQVTRWPVSLLLAVLTIFFSLIVLGKPAFLTSILLRLGGAMLVYSGLSNIWILRQ